MIEGNHFLPASLDDQLWFESLMGDLSARFINMPAHLVDSAVEDAQRIICEHLGLDRSTLWQQQLDDPETLLLTHLYQVGDTPPIIRTSLPDRAPGSEPGNPIGNRSTIYLRIDGTTAFPWTVGQVQHGLTVVVPSLAELPEEAAIDKEWFARYGTQSTVVVPLSVAGETLGCLSFAMMREQRRWPEGLVRRFQLIGYLLANALARKRAEHELSVNRERLKLATEAAGAGSWILELDSHQVWATRRIRELFEFTPDAALTREDFFLRIHPEDRDRVRTVLQAAVQSGDTFVMEYRVILRDGALRWISSRGRRECTDAGQPQRLMGVSLDITDRKLADEKLHKSFAEIRLLKDRLQAETDYLRAEIKVVEPHSVIKGESQAIRKALYQVRQVAPTDTTVLICGETGVGKELFAEAIHRLSPRNGQVLVKVNCAALPAPLVESELFGREKGAYTGALSHQAGRFDLADRSSIFLDEIAELSPEVQVKLLRVLQEGQFERLGSPKTIKVNARLIAATNRDLAEEVRKGRFRQDLFYRLNVFPIKVPPLRERQDDIPLLIWTFVEEFSSRMGKKITQIPRRSMEALINYPWPGNVRELRNVIERSVIISSGETLRVAQLQEMQVNSQPVTLADTEREHIVRTLEKTMWHIKGPRGAAGLLGLKPSTLYTRMQKLGIPNRRQRDGMRT